MRMARNIILRRSGGPWLTRAPRRDRAPRARRRFALLGVVVHEVGVVVDRRQLVGLDVERLRERGRLDLGALRLAFGERAVRARALHRERGERVVRDQLRARLLRDAARAAEVVGVRVRDDDGVHVLELVARGLEPLLQRLPRLRTGQAGVDHGEPAVVDEAVHVHVTEAGHPDRQLHAQHARRDLGDLFRRRLLLLARRPGGFRLRIGHAFAGYPTPNRQIGETTRSATFSISAKASSMPPARTSRSAAASRSAQRPKCIVPS